MSLSAFPPAWPETAVAFTTSPWTHSLVEYRLRGPLESSGIRLIQGNEYEQAAVERVSQADLVVIQRDFPRYWDAYRQVIQAARAQDKPVLYDLDDLLLELPEEHPDRPIHYYTGALVPMLHAISEADGVTVSTHLLREYLTPLNANTWLLPNYLNDRLWAFTKTRSMDTERPVVIGYMGGDSHLPDLESIAPVFLRLLDRYSGAIQLRFWGAQPPQALRGHPRVEWNPVSLPDYRQYIDFFSHQRCDIFVAPLKPSLFNRCKSSVKFLEYSIQGIPGVYSQIEPFEQVVVNGENGFLAASLEEWENGLVCLIENRNLRVEMGRKAQETVQKNWLLSQHAGELKQVYRQAPAGKHPKEKTQAALFENIASQLEEHRRYIENQSQDLRAQLIQKEQSERALAGRLNDLETSTGWKLIKRLWALRLALAPAGSRRERLLRRMVRK